MVFSSKLFLRMTPQYLVDFQRFMSFSQYLCLTTYAK